jgi:hypothetical protein
MKNQDAAKISVTRRFANASVDGLVPLEHFPPKWISRAFTPVFAGYGSATRKCDKPTNLERILAQARPRVVQYERNAL